MRTPRRGAAAITTALAVGALAFGAAPAFAVETTAPADEPPAETQADAVEPVLALPGDGRVLGGGTTTTVDLAAEGISADVGPTDPLPGDPVQDPAPVDDPVAGEPVTDDPVTDDPVTGETETPADPGESTDPIGPGEPIDPTEPTETEPLEPVDEAPVVPDEPGHIPPAPQKPVVDAPADADESSAPLPSEAPGGQSPQRRDDAPIAPRLADTGADDVLGVLGAGLVLVAAGSGMLVVRRRSADARRA